jgi:hypothetical protein
MALLVLIQSLWNVWFCLLSWLFDWSMLPSWRLVSRCNCVRLVEPASFIVKIHISLIILLTITAPLRSIVKPLIP